MMVVVVADPPGARQGSGKGLLFAFFRERILGAACSYQTANPEHDLLSRFQNGCVARVFIQAPEKRDASSLFPSSRP